MNSIFQKENVYANVTAYYAVSISEFHMNLHMHDSCEIMYVTSGGCTVQCQGEELKLHQNQFIFIDAGVPHHLLIPQGQPCSMLNLEFQCRKEVSAIPLTQLYQNSPKLQEFCRKKIPFAVSEDLRDLGYALKDVIGYLQKNDSGEEYLFSVLFWRMLLELSYCVIQNKKSAGFYYLKKACAYIEDNLCEPLKVPEIAACTGVNKSYLQLLFSRFLHCTIIDYVNQKRMERAAFFLINSSTSITDLAFLTGYNSRQHFAHTFEKYFGMSPQKYRKLHARILAPDTGKAQMFPGQEKQRKEIF